MESPGCLDRDQLSIAMKMLNGADLKDYELPPHLALYMGGMALSKDPKGACIEEITKAFRCDRKSTVELAKEIGLDLRQYGITRNMVFGPKS